MNSAMAGLEQHLPLVDQVVQQVAGGFPRYVDRRELVRDGVLGLVEAASRYDGERGVPFDRFAARRIRGAVLDAVRSADWAPRSVRSASRRADAAEQELTARLGRVPTVQELADALGQSPDEVARLRGHVFRSLVLALDHRVNDGDDLNLVEVLHDRTSLEPDEQLENREMHAYLRDAVALLPERHRTVIVGYFLEGRSSEELAGLLGVTESRISQMRSEALGMLRGGIEAQYSDDAVVTGTAGRAARRRANYASAVGTRSVWRDRLTEAGDVVSLRPAVA
jgi:RNA polymerase sigma factor for flagellar operon FliA